MRPIPTTALAILVTALTSAVAVAQTRPATPPRPNRAAPAVRDSQMTQRRDGAQRADMMRGAGPASALLRMRERLELTDDQVKRLQTLQSAARPERNAADELRARADLMDATKGDINLDKARAAYDKMARLRTDQQVAQLKLRQDVRGVLTPAQRTQFDTWNAQAQRRGGMIADGRRGQMRGGRDGAPMRGGRAGQFGPQNRRSMSGPGMPGAGGRPQFNRGGRRPGMGAGPARPGSVPGTPPAPPVRRRMIDPDVGPAA